MDHDDPITQFFPGQEHVDLYDVLSIQKDSQPEVIKKAYRRLALAWHPDKHTTSSASVKTEASIKFQQIGFAYAVLSDEKRRARYDKTGRTDEGFELAAGDDGWEAYFEAIFDRVTRGKLDEMKKEYQGSPEEVDDLKNAYISTNGSIEEIMSHIPHSTYTDEARFVIIIAGLIRKGDLPALPMWETSIKDKKSKLVRKKRGEKEAKEAEKLAKELGVWDEFYGSGKTGKRIGKSKGQDESKTEEEAEGDVSALQALILKKKQKNMDSFFDSLATKYAEPETSSKTRGKGKKRDRDEEDDFPQKKSRRAPPPAPEIGDEEFERLQQKLFPAKAKASTSPAEAPNPKSKRVGKKSK